VGDYDVDRKVGSGSFAKVYRATHRRTRQVVAIKAVDKKKLNVRHQQNLASEIKIMRRFQHWNLVRLLGTYSGPRHMYLVMEFCGGGDLAGAIAKHGPLPESPIVERLMAQLAAGLEFLWTRNLIHRDIKPQNILLTGGLGSTLKIADFGFARYLGAAALAETACGSPLYMAPEVLRRETYNAKADLWSVGCVMFEMLAKETPFTGFDQTELLHNVESGKCAPMPAGVRISEACASLLRGLLRQDQLQRLSFREFFASRFVTRGRAVLDAEGFLEYGDIVKGGSSSTSTSSSSSSKGGGAVARRRRAAPEPMDNTTAVAAAVAANSMGSSASSTGGVRRNSASGSGIRGSHGGGSDGAQHSFAGHSQAEPPAPMSGVSMAISSASLPPPDSNNQSDSDDFVLVDTTSSKKQVIFKQANAISQAPSPHEIQPQQYQQQHQQPQTPTSSTSSSSSSTSRIGLPPTPPHRPSSTTVSVLPMSLRASDALPFTRQSDQLWRRGLAVGQLAEALLRESHGRSSTWCSLFKDAQCPDNKSLEATKDWLITALAVALRSLVLLHSAYERRQHAVGSSGSGGDRNSRRGSKTGGTGSSGEQGGGGGGSSSGSYGAGGGGGVFPDDNMLHEDDNNTSKQLGTSSGNSSKDSSRDGSAGGGSNSGVDDAMKKQIGHYAEVTMLAREQLMKLAQLSGKDAVQAVIRGDLDMRAEDAVFHAVIDMSRRAAGLQALTLSCTTSRDARVHSASHAQTLYEHALCLLEDLLANAQGDVHRRKFQRLAGLAESLTGRLHDLRASTVGSMPGPGGGSLGGSQRRNA
jgi:serine/threonine-protein kinase ULK2